MLRSPLSLSVFTFYTLLSKHARNEILIQILALSAYFTKLLHIIIVPLTCYKGGHHYTSPLHARTGKWRQIQACTNALNLIQPAYFDRICQYRVCVCVLLLFYNKNDLTNAL